MLAQLICLVFGHRLPPLPAGSLKSIVDCDRCRRRFDLAAQLDLDADMQRW